MYKYVKQMYRCANYIIRFYNRSKMKLHLSQRTDFFYHAIFIADINITRSAIYRSLKVSHGIYVKSVAGALY